jgi:putative peptide zinc metalloprotease protein
MEDSGFEQTPYLVKRPDGQVVQLPQLLYALAERLDGRTGYDQIAAGVSQAVGAGLEPDDARFLVDEKLAPLGLIAGRETEHRPAQPDVANDLLALSWKGQVVPEGVSRVLTSIFKPLFLGPVVLVAVAAFLALDGWLFFSHGISQPVRQLIYNPALLVALFAGVVIATAFHEIGHATALRYGGGKPGVMGVGLYVIWPVFYTDVTEAYGLDRRARLRTDLGGVYFNALFALACAAAYLATRWEPILVLVMVQTFAIIQQLLPLGRLDGYLILTDLTGVPDLLSRMKPILRSAIPGRRREERVRDLKPWVRRVATGYILILVPVLLFIFAMMLINAPRVFATTYDSLGVRWHHVTSALDHGQTGAAIGNLFQCAALVLPAAGIVMSAGRIGRRAGVGALSWSAGAPLRRALLVGASAATAGVAIFLWWPNGEYRPIQPGERGTIQGGLQQVAAVSSGNRALTPQHDSAASKSNGGKQAKDTPASQQTTTTRVPSQTGTTTTPVDTTPTTGTSTSTTPTSTTPDPSGTTTSTTPTSTDTTTSTAPAPAPATTTTTTGTTPTTTTP